MRIAVVTPYYKEPTDILRRCHDSVMAQTCPVTHIMVSDGHPNPEVDQWNAIHVRLPVGKSVDRVRICASLG